MSKMNETATPEQLSENLNALFNYVARVRVEIAALNKSDGGDDQFTTMSKQLDGVIEATQDASDRIMDAVENSNDSASELRKALTDPAQLALLDKIVESNNVVFDACAFQDLTGQRVSKIVKSVSYVEERVMALRAIWGARELDSVEIEAEELTEDEKLLNGPQSKAEALGQADIDALFD
jgi:chemotaxis protein CheZ